MGSIWKLLVSYSALQQCITCVSYQAAIGVIKYPNNPCKIHYSTLIKNIAGMEKMSCESDTVNKIGSNKALFPSLVSILGCANCEIKIDYFLSLNFTLKIGCYDDNLFAIIFVLSTSKIILSQL